MMMRGKGKKDERDWIRYHLSPLRDRAKRELLDVHGEPAAVFARGARRIARDGSVPREAAERFLGESVDVDAVLAAVARAGGSLFTWADPAYPELLRECYDPPMVLFYRGDRALLGEPVVSIVGARKADPAAARHTVEVAKSLARAGFTVGSGLAIGIDGAAHRGALDGGGGTIAVMGTGIDQIYPRFHRKLGERIAASGLLLTEFPPLAPSYPANFPKRNRVIAGISRAVLIAQASARSGAGITGRLALEADRDLFVLAAPPWDRRFAGNARFALEGAPVVQDGDDLVVRLGGTPAPPEERCEAAIRRLPAPARRLARAIGDEPADLDRLGRKLDRPAGELLADLMRLELEELVVKGADGRYQLNRKGSRF